jgi:hypothetical protein
LKQNPVATLKYFCAQSFDECLHRHLKHVLKLDGHPLLWETLLFAIAEHNKQTETGTRVNLLTATMIADSRPLRLLKSSNVISKVLDAATPPYWSAPSTNLVIAMYLS